MRPIDIKFELRASITSGKHYKCLSSAKIILKYSALVPVPTDTKENSVVGVVIPDVLLLPELIHNG